MKQCKQHETVKNYNDLSFAQQKKLSAKWKDNLQNQFSSVQSLSRVWLFAIPWIAARQASLSIANSQSSLRLTSIRSVMPSSHLILCCPLLLLPPIPPRRTIQKRLHDQDNHDGMITHLKPDILECEVKWALESITMNKASGGDRIPVELFQILKDDAWKCCTQYASKFGKLSSGHRTGKGQFSF